MWNIIFLIIFSVFANLITVLSIRTHFFVIYSGPWCYTTDPDKRFDYCRTDDCIDDPGVKCWIPGEKFKEE